MQRLEILWNGSWMSSDGETLTFNEERITRSIGDSLQFGFSQSIDETPLNRTSWSVTSQKPITEEERQSKIPAIRETFSTGPDDTPEKFPSPRKIAGIEAWELPGSKTQVDFMDAYAPYSVASEALWLPIGQAFVEFIEAVLETPAIEQYSQMKPKWLTKQAPEKIQMLVPEIVQAIEQWTPKQLYKNEEAYEGSLSEYLVGRGIDAPQQQGKSLTDILAAHGIGIEIKVKPNRGEYDRLSGQIMRQLEEFGIVVVLIIRPNKLDLFNEYKARFASDDRVTFIHK